jgi:hypothetical protein
MASSSAQVPGSPATRGFFDSVLGAWRHATGPAPATAPAAATYGSQRVPYSMMSKPTPPAVHELSRLLDRQRARGGCRHLQMVEQTLRLEQGGFDLVPAPLLRTAHRELQMLARRSTPTPALARLLDVFERRLIDVEIRSFIERTSERPMSRAPSSHETRVR